MVALMEESEAPRGSSGKVKPPLTQLSQEEKGSNPFRGYALKQLYYVEEHS